MEYPKQYLLSTTPTSPFEDWRKREFGPWWLHHAPDLPLIRVEDALGNEIGLLFGWVIFRGCLLADGETLSSQHQCEGVANEYDELAGRFNYLYLFRDEFFLLTDASGLLSPVYSAECQALASTPTLLRQVASLQRDEAVWAAFSEGQSQVWYPFGLTPFSGVRRVLPNHRLSLSSWEVRRVFPAPPQVLAYRRQRNEVLQAVMEIAESIKANVDALIDAGNHLVNLTAGHDTRMVLAACRPYLTKCQFQTVAVDSHRAKLDGHVASELARRFELKYRQLPVVKPSIQELDEWQQRIGECVTDRSAQLCATAKRYGRYMHEIDSAGGELCRGARWLAGDDSKQNISAIELLHRLGIDSCEITINAAQSWLDELQGYTVGDTLDLAYIELHLGCRAGPSIYGHPVSFPPLSPFSSHFIFQRLIMLPTSYRISGQFVRDYLNLLWPELQRVPFNRAAGLARLKYSKVEIPWFEPATCSKLLQFIRQCRLGTGSKSRALSG